MTIFCMYEDHPENKFSATRKKKLNYLKDLLQKMQEIFSCFSTYEPPEL